MEGELSKGKTMEKQNSGQCSGGDSVSMPEGSKGQGAAGGTEAIDRSEDPVEFIRRKVAELRREVEFSSPEAAEQFQNCLDRIEGNIGVLEKGIQAEEKLTEVLKGQGRKVIKSVFDSGVGISNFEKEELSKFWEEGEPIPEVASEEESETEEEDENGTRSAEEKEESEDETEFEEDIGNGEMRGDEGSSGADGDLGGRMPVEVVMESDEEGSLLSLNSDGGDWEERLSGAMAATSFSETEEGQGPSSSSQDQGGMARVLFNCTLCAREFSSHGKLAQHLRATHKMKDYKGFGCSFCGVIFSTADEFHKHQKWEHPGCRIKSGAKKST